MLTEHLVERSAQTRFLAVVGPSGSGKSSVVRAGLVPRLRQGALPGSERWYVVEMFPGAYPLEELEAALLRAADNPPAGLLEQLEQDERGLLRAVKRLLADDESELVLVVDQLEEVFTLVEDEARRTHSSRCSSARSATRTPGCASWSRSAPTSTTGRSSTAASRSCCATTSRRSSR